MSGFARVASSLPVGTFIPIMGGNIPAGFIPMGAWYEKARYSKLWAAVGGLVQASSTHFYIPPHPGFLKAAKIGSTPFETVLGYPGSPLTDSLTNVDMRHGGFRCPDVSGLNGVLVTRTLRGKTKSLTTGKWAFGVRVINAPGAAFSNATVGVFADGVSLTLMATSPLSAAIMFSDAGSVGGNIAGFNAYKQATSYPLAGLTLDRAGAGYVIFLVDLTTKKWGVCTQSYANETVGSDNISTLGAGAYEPRCSMSIQQDGSNLGFAMGMDFIFGDFSDIPNMPAGYQNMITMSDFGYSSAVQGGAETHTHTVGGTALSIAQMPAHTHNVTTSGVSAAGSGYSQTGAGSDGQTLGATYTTTSQGSGQTHAHTLTWESSLPPHLTAIYAIKY